MVSFAAPHHRGFGVNKAVIAGEAAATKSPEEMEMKTNHLTFNDVPFSSIPHTTRRQIPSCIRFSSRSKHKTFASKQIPNFRGPQIKLLAGAGRKKIPSR